MTNDENMARSLWYDATTAALTAQRERAAILVWQLQQIRPDDTAAYASVIAKLFPHCGKDVIIQPPLAVDYGQNCYLGDGTFINYGAYFMDGAPIRLGRHCFIGPRCSFYTAVHPLVAADRNQGLERALPITLGDNVWLGGDVTILPGVTIGDGAVIGAKSCVTKDIPPQVLAVGNPCVVIRTLTEADALPDHTML